tara:strand:- start:372 stop:518 length:147 start_codon:yes stop_codon:yes gene_type:complete
MVLAGDGLLDQRLLEALAVDLEVLLLVVDDVLPKARVRVRGPRRGSHA